MSDRHINDLEYEYYKTYLTNNGIVLNPFVDYNTLRKQWLEYRLEFGGGNGLAPSYVEPQLVGFTGSGSISGLTATSTGAGFVGYTDPVVIPDSIYQFELADLDEINANICSNLLSIGSAPTIRVLATAELLRTNFDSQLDDVWDYNAASPKDFTVILNFVDGVVKVFGSLGTELASTVIDGTTVDPMIVCANTSTSGAQSVTLRFDKTTFTNNQGGDLGIYLGTIGTVKQIGE